MAKKKQTELTYGQVPLPSGRKYYKMVKRSWSGLNKRQVIDTGMLSMESNISTAETPYLTPSAKWQEQSFTYAGSGEIVSKYYVDGIHPISLFGFDDFLLVIYRKDRTIYADYITQDGYVHAGKVGDALTETARDEPQRSVVQFNVYDTPINPRTGEYVKKLLIFPDKVSMYMKIDNAQYSGSDDPLDWDASTIAKKEKGVLYCYKGGSTLYYRLLNLSGEMEEVGNANEFPIDAMDVIVKEYYNDDSSETMTVGNEATIISLSAIQNIGEKNKNGTFQGVKSAKVTFKTANCKEKAYGLYKYDDTNKRWITAMAGAVTDENMTFEVEFDFFKTYSIMLKVYTGEGASDVISLQKKITLSETITDNSINTETEEDTGTEENIAGYYPPDETADTSYYYFNTYNKKVYRYCEYDTEDGGTEYGWKECVPPSVPDLKYATVHLSRVFGVDESRVYASGFNDYCNWNLDTIGETNESNSWCSPSQSNVKADGEFKGITAYQGHIICFKRDFMHEIYNTKNPFRLVDIFAEGTIDNRTIQEVNGRLFFVADGGVKIYSGSNPREMGYQLNISEYGYAVSGSDDRCYYLYCEDRKNNWTKHLFVYDTYAEQWSEQKTENRILNFARNKNGVFYLDDEGYIYQLTELYNHNWSFETDLITNQTVDIKHIKKIQLFADIAENAWIRVYVLYDDEVFDSDNPYKHHMVYYGIGGGQKAIRVKPRKTAHYGMKLHVEGYGYVRMYELELSMETGGGLYV